MRRLKRRHLRPPARCRSMRPTAAHFRPFLWCGERSFGKNHADFQKPGKILLVNRPQRRRIYTEEPAAKAILPEPRSVQKANSYQSVSVTLYWLGCWQAGLGEVGCRHRNCHTLWWKNLEVRHHFKHVTVNYRPAAAPPIRKTSPAGRQFGILPGGVAQPTPRTERRHS